MKLQKKTSSHGKWYDDACGAAFGFELIGERWSALIVREMMFGPRRFTDLRGGLPGISAKVLTERLEGLERADVVQRCQLPPPASGQVYGLTEWGYRADGVLLSLCRWALASPGHDHALPLSAAALMMSLRALFDPARAGDWAVTGEIGIGQDRFSARLADGHLEIFRGEAETRCFAIVAPDAMVLKRLFYGKLPVAQLADAGLAVTGDVAKALKFIDLFHLPLKVDQAPSPRN